MVRRIAAAERLDRTQFRSDVEYLEHVVQLAGYRCPHCGAGGEFEGRHWWQGRPFGAAAAARWTANGRRLSMPPDLCNPANGPWISTAPDVAHPYGSSTGW